MATVCYKEVVIETALHPAFPDYVDKVLEGRVAKLSTNPRSPNMHPKGYEITYEDVMPWFDKEALNNDNVESSYSKLMTQLANRKHNANYIKEIADTVSRDLVFKYEIGLWRYEA